MLAARDLRIALVAAVGPGRLSLSDRGDSGIRTPTRPPRFPKAREGCPMLSAAPLVGSRGIPGRRARPRGLGRLQFAVLGRARTPNAAEVKTRVEGDSSRVPPPRRQTGRDDRDRVERPHETGSIRRDLARFPRRWNAPRRPSRRLRRPLLDEALVPRRGAEGQSLVEVPSRRTTLPIDLVGSRLPSPFPLQPEPPGPPSWFRPRPQAVLMPMPPVGRPHGRCPDPHRRLQRRPRQGRPDAPRWSRRDDVRAATKESSPRTRTGPSGPACSPGSPSPTSTPKRPATAARERTVLKGLAVLIDPSSHVRCVAPRSARPSRPRRRHPAGDRRAEALPDGPRLRQHRAARAGREEARDNPSSFTPRSTASLTNPREARSVRESRARSSCFAIGRTSPRGRTRCRWSRTPAASTARLLHRPQVHPARRPSRPGNYRLRLTQKDLVAGHVATGETAIAIVR